MPHYETKMFILLKHKEREIFEILKMKNKIFKLYEYFWNGEDGGYIWKKITHVLKKWW